jgi:hypothetical protein
MITEVLFSLVIFDVEAKNAGAGATVSTVLFISFLNVSS